jgi:hypothetical protein
MTEINSFRLCGRGASDEGDRAGLIILLISINEIPLERFHYGPQAGVRF